jgi:uncharacterized protein (DUF305 family)
MRFALAFAVAAFCAAPVAAYAADDVMAYPEACRAKPAGAMAGMNHGAPAAAPTAASGHSGHGPALKEHQRAAEAGMRTMDRDMAAGMMQDDADVAFICGMIAHHQGAIAMSEVELKYGKDPAARAMAEKVIAAQKPEIIEMQAWVAKTVRK